LQHHHRRGEIHLEGLVEAVDGERRNWLGRPDTGVENERGHRSKRLVVDPHELRYGGAIGHVHGDVPHRGCSVRQEFLGEFLQFRPAPRGDGQAVAAFGQPLGCSAPDAS